MANVKRIAILPWKVQQPVQRESIMPVEQAAPPVLTVLRFPWEWCQKGFEVFFLTGASAIP